MDVNKFISQIWLLISKRRLSANVTKVDNELAVSIIKKRKIKHFKSKIPSQLLNEIEFYLGV